MQSNFHTHTYRCHHAAGEDREYVEAAIEKGLQVLGFSDHSPYWFPDGHNSAHRMETDRVENYVTSVLSLKEEYKDDIRIFLGFEAEYYPLYFDTFLEHIAPYPIDYLILGQHYLQNEILLIRSAEQTDDKSRLHQYVDECIAAMDTGKFFYMAHPDILHYEGDDACYETEMRRLCMAAKMHHIPLEINLLGIRENRFYPNPAFWEIAGEVGNDVIFGCDAHSPSCIAREEDIQGAMHLVNRFHLHRIEPLYPHIEP